MPPTIKYSIFRGPVGTRVMCNCSGVNTSLAPAQILDKREHHDRQVQCSQAGPEV